MRITQISTLRKQFHSAPSCRASNDLVSVGSLHNAQRKQEEPSNSSVCHFAKVQKKYKGIINLFLSSSSKGAWPNVARSRSKTEAFPATD
jgi:hypothetical protein